MKKFNELLSNIKDIEESIQIDEVLKASDPTSKWISDFVHSDNPKFEGKSKKQRINMALGAAYAAKRASKNEELDLSVIENIAEELYLEIIEQKSDLEYAEDARIEALKLKEDDNLDGFHMLMAIHHCHLSEHFAENQKHNLAEKHDLLAVEHLNELDESYSSELLEKLLTDGVASATANYGVPITIVPAGPAKNKTWSGTARATSARGTSYDASVDKEVRTSKTKTPATINPKRRKEVEQEINRKAIFGEEIEQHEGVAEAKAWEPKVVFSGTGADGSKYKITHAGPTDFMIHANDKHIDTYSSLHRAKNVLKNEVPGLKQGVAEAINPDNPRDYNIPTYLRKRKGQAPLTTKDIKDRDTESPTTPEGLAKKAKKLGIDEGMTPAVSASIGGSMGSSGRAYAKAKLLAAKARGIKEGVERVDEVSAKWVRQHVPYYPDRAIDAVHIAQRPYRGKYDTDAEAKEADRIIRVRTKGYERYAKKNSKENPPPKVTPSDNPGYYSNRPKSGFGSGREDDTYGT